MAIQKTVERRMNGATLRLTDGNEYSRNGGFGVVLPFNGDFGLPKMTNSFYKGVREEVFRNASQTLINKVQSLQHELKYGNPGWPDAKMSEGGLSLQPGSVVTLEYSGMPFKISTKRVLLAVMLTGTPDKNANGLVLQETAENCLKVARKEKFESISFPLEVPHHREVDFEDKAMAFFHAAWSFLREHKPESNPVKTITFYMHNVYTQPLIYEAQRYFNNLFP